MVRVVIILWAERVGERAVLKCMSDGEGVGENSPGFCKSAKIVQNGVRHFLTLSRTTKKSFGIRGTRIDQSNIFGILDTRLLVGLGALKKCNF